MGVVSEIRDLLKLVTTNQRAGLWLIVIVAVLGIGCFFYLKKTNKPVAESDCAFIKQQNKELLAFILEAQRQVKELAQPTSFLITQDTGYFIYASATASSGNNKLMYASYADTIPKKETKQQKAAVLLSKFDSLLLKVKEDSIKRATQKQKQ